MCWVSRQKPTRSGCPAASATAASCSNVRPMVSPAPAVFSSDVGVDNDALAFGGGYVWFDVLGVTPSHERSLDEVKDQVEARWRAEQITERLRKMASEQARLERAEIRGTRLSARAYMAVGRHDDALGCFDTALRLRPDYAEVFYNRGNVLRKLKRTDSHATNPPCALLRSNSSARGRRAR